MSQRPFNLRHLVKRVSPSDLPRDLPSVDAIANRAKRWTMQTLDALVRTIVREELAAALRLAPSPVAALDPVEAFVATLARGADIGASELYRGFLSWREAQGLPLAPMSIQRFGRRLTRVGALRRYDAPGGSRYAVL